MVGGVETAGSAPSGVDGRLDGGDTIFGDAGGDAVAGDNTVIERALTGARRLDPRRPPQPGCARASSGASCASATSRPSHDLAPLTNGTSGGDTIFGNDGVDVAYGQGGEDTIQGNAGDDHLEGNAGDDTITGNEGRDDVIGGTGRTFSNDESTATAGRIDNAAGDDAANDDLHGGDGLGGVASDDDDVIVGDNATVDRDARHARHPGRRAEPAAVQRGVGRGDLGRAEHPPGRPAARRRDDGEHRAGDERHERRRHDQRRGERGCPLRPGRRPTRSRATTPISTRADLGRRRRATTTSRATAAPTLIHGNFGEDDITGGGSATTGVLDANRDGTLDPARSGETLRDGNDLIAGDNGDGTAGDGDVVAGDNARIQRPLAGRRLARSTRSARTSTPSRARSSATSSSSTSSSSAPASPATRPTGESGVDTISGNGGEDILLGQGNGARRRRAYGNESGIARTGGLPGRHRRPRHRRDRRFRGGAERRQRQRRPARPERPAVPRRPPRATRSSARPARTTSRATRAPTTPSAARARTTSIGGSSANTGHLNVILPPADRDAGFAPGAITRREPPFNLVDGHDVIEGNAEDDIVAGDNAFVDRYIGAAGAWLTIGGPGRRPVRGHRPAEPGARPRRVDGDRHGPPRRDDRRSGTSARRLRQRLRPGRRRQGRRLRPARQRLARGQRGRGRDRRRHGQDRRQPARRPDAGRRSPIRR